MKKLLLFFVILFMPSLVMAAEITSANMTSDTKDVVIGSNVDVNVSVSYSDVTKGVNSGYGVSEIVYEIKFDEDILVPTAIETPGFDSAIVKLNGAYYVYSQVGDGEDSNKCYDKILYCDSYKAKITFFVKLTEASTTKLTLRDVEVTFFEVAKDDGNPVENDKLSLANVTLNISKSANTTVEEPKAITEYSKPAENNSKTSVTSETKKEETKVDSDKSPDNFLSKLYIKGYNLEFYKRTNDYELEVEKGVNNLEIEAILSDKRAVLEIVGADNLKANNNKVTITVTAENGEKNVYTIKVKEETDSEVKMLSDVSMMAKASNLYKKYKVYIFIGGGIIILGIILSLIFNKVNDDKLGRKFDNL